MALTKKTTILLPPDLHEHLTRLARERRISLGEVIRSACEAQYGRWSRADRIEAVERLARMNLPVGTPAKMKRESARYSKVPPT